MVKLLLGQDGVDMNLKDENRDGDTALMNAISKK
jgi:hypothetical protein